MHIVYLFSETFFKLSFEGITLSFKAIKYEIYPFGNSHTHSFKRTHSKRTQRRWFLCEHLLLTDKLWVNLGKPLYYVCIYTIYIYDIVYIYMNAPVSNQTITIWLIKYFQKHQVFTFTSPPWRWTTCPSPPAYSPAAAPAGDAAGPPSPPMPQCDRRCSAHCCSCGSCGSARRAPRRRPRRRQTGLR